MTDVAQAAQQASKTAVGQVTQAAFCTDERYFIDVSVAVTGFDPVDLYGTGMAGEYHAVLLRQVGPEAAFALYRWYVRERETQALSEHALRCLPELPAQPSYLADIARAVAKLWYLGAWHALPQAAYQALTQSTSVTGDGHRAGHGTATTETAMETPSIAPNESFVVSPQAYLSGLVWKLTGGHPPGGKPTGFGSWAKQPPAIPETPTGAYKESF